MLRFRVANVTFQKSQNVDGRMCLVAGPVKKGVLDKSGTFCFCKVLAVCLVSGQADRPAPVAGGLFYAVETAHFTLSPDCHAADICLLPALV